MKHGVYVVTGQRRYRGHPPGTEFVALIDPNAERRAVARHDIELVARIVPKLPANHHLPKGWV